MLEVTVLSRGLGEGEVSVEQCQKQTGMSATDCSVLLTEIATNTDLYNAIARSIILYATKKGCVHYVTLQTNAPPKAVDKIIEPACSWAVGKLATVGEWIADVWPTSDSPMDYAALWVDGDLYKSILWRDCPKLSDLQPGEYWDSGLKRCGLNIALLKNNDEKVAVYVPCEYQPDDARRGGCIDKDGVTRQVGKKGHYWPGIYGRRHNPTSCRVRPCGWPTRFEETPWQSPLSPADQFRQLQLTVKSTQKLSTSTMSAAEAFRRTNLPTYTIEPLKIFEPSITERKKPWYKKPAAVATVASVGALGAYAFFRWGR